MTEVLCFELLLWCSLALPALAFVSLASLMLFAPHASERSITRITAPCFLGSWLASLGAVALSCSIELPVTTTGFTWFSVGHYDFHLGLLADTLSLAMVLLVTSIVGLVGRFSLAYLHRDPGFSRFFMLLGLFSFGMLLLVASATLDGIFVGWELVGLSSALLIGFFHGRRAPVEAGARAFSTYRLCDVGLLLGVVLLHRFGGTSELVPWGAGMGHDPGLQGTQATLVSLCCLLGAMGKSAQAPVGGYLPRAMEGPTPSSALFYGGLSVHAGVYLLLRISPILSSSPLAAAAVAVVGAVTALHASLVVRVQSDAKTTLAYAVMAQVGLIFVEIGLGFHRLALVHLLAHACLRTYQLLRAPSALRDAQDVRAALGHAHPPSGSSLLSESFRLFLYRLAIDRFHLETLQRRWLIDPLLAVSIMLDRLERRFVETFGTTAEAEGRELRHETPGLPKGR